MSKMLLAFGVLGVFAGSVEIAEAARCPQGEIYRPSRGICVSRSVAIQSGIIGSGRQTRFASVSSGSSERAREPAAETPKPSRAEAPRRSLVATSDDAPLAYAPDEPIRRAILQKARAMSQEAAKPRAPSPYGGLVALDPAP